MPSQKRRLLSQLLESWFGAHVLLQLVGPRRLRSIVAISLFFYGGMSLGIVCVCICLSAAYLDSQHIVYSVNYRIRLPVSLIGTLHIVLSLGMAL